MIFGSQDNAHSNIGLLAIVLPFIKYFFMKIGFQFFIQQDA
ncbi:unnamed protein product [Paramecium sonneborni]|uniref:Uncharacterized protein n=1 Tax=Paramecium sonneborni TaxID=65129 RepID=A0A8S1RLU6_9CILI|nr:unnamed protein product [Paramecium sonneborni]